MMFGLVDCAIVLVDRLMTRNDSIGDGWWKSMRDASSKGLDPKPPDGGGPAERNYRWRKFLRSRYPEGGRRAGRGGFRGQIAGGAHVGESDVVGVMRGAVG